MAPATSFEFPLFQLFAMLFSLAMIFHVISGWRRGTRSLREFVAWMLFWGVVGVAGAWPHLVDVAGRTLGIKSGTNTIIFFALIVLFYITLRSAFIIEGLEERLSELARRMALEEFREQRALGDARASAEERRP